MRIVRGEHVGQAGRVCQWANDWVTVQLDSGERLQPMPPTRIQLTEPQEFAMFRERRPQHIGIFWDLWELAPNGMFDQIHEPAREYRGSSSRRGRTGRRR